MLTNQVSRFLRRRSVATTLWYRAGGAPMPVAAYQPLGAASLAASYINLANPGTYDAAPGVAPGLAAGGWAFNGTTQYLATGITPGTDGSWSVLVRYAGGGSNQMVFGGQGGTGQFYLWIRSGNTEFGNNGFLFVPPQENEGVLGFGGRTAYSDGISVGSISVSPGIQREIYLAAYNNAGTPALFFGGTIAAIAIYSSTLDAAQVAAVSAAMIALA